MKLHATSALLVMLAALSATTPQAAAATSSQPNVVLITADDMTDYDLRWMPKTRRLIGSPGTTMTDFVANQPLCCPARANLLTGQHGHNNGVHTNSGQWGGNDLIDPTNHVGRWFQDAGYETAFVGKFLNDFDRFNVSGWDHFNDLTHNIYSPYGFTTREDGHIEGEYTTNYVGRKMIDYTHTDKPFFIWASQIAPHGMSVNGRWHSPVPHPAHKDLYPNARPPSTSKPSYNEPDVSDKPLAYQQAKKSDRKVVNKFRARIRSLKSVDNQNARLVQSLRNGGLLENTLIVFTSDNGYLLGEHRLMGKNYPFEEALQIPLVMRGPEIPVGRTVAGHGTLVDLPATMADVAGVAPQRTQDGVSLIPVINGGNRPMSLIQAGSATRSPGTDWWWRGVRTNRYTYVEHDATGEVELYDRVRDPYQLKSLDEYRPTKEQSLRDHLNRLRQCVGSDCY